MMRNLVAHAGACVLLITLACLPASRTLAQSKTASSQTNPPASHKASASTKPSAGTEKRQTSGPFHGNLKAVDQQARTITMGKRTFHVTPETKIVRGDKSATLQDAVLGESVSGYFKTAEDGRLVLASLRFGSKPKANPQGKNSGNRTEE